VDPGAAVRDLNQFSATGRVEPRPDFEDNDVDVESYLANLQTQTTKSMIQDGLDRAKLDFDSFLDEKLAIEWTESRKRIYQHFGITPKETSGLERSGFAHSAGESQAGFGRSRRSKAATAASSRAANGGYSDSKFARSGMAKSVIGAAGPLGSGSQPLFSDVEKNMESHGVNIVGPHDRFQRDKEARFTEKVRALNSARLQKRPYPVCEEFASVVKASGEHFSSELANAYNALIEIVGESADVTSFAEPNAVKERQYAAAYFDENPNSVQRQQIKKRILRGGAKCLEKLKFQEMEEFVAKHPREANLGGIPNVISKVKAYVRLQATRKNLAADNADLQQLEDDYVWALIFNLLRTGHVQEAVEYVASNSVAFRALDRNFASYITDYANSPDRRLRRELQDRISNEYNQRLRIAPENSIDPYRMACYKIIGRCDLRNRQLEGIKLAGLQDFMWLQLALARETNRVDEIATEAYGLAEAQNLIRELGNRHFSTKSGASDVGSSWGAFVLYQMVFGLFEEAVSYLYTYSYVDGVHLAIALDLYGLLRVSDPNAAGDDFMSTTTRGQNQINFGRMLGYYTRDFRAADVGAAVDYLSLICLNRDLPSQLGQSQTKLCHEALRELVLESREYALLLGDIRGDGQRVKGVIEERMALIGLDATDDFMRAITIQAASIADDNGRTTDAVLLYHLAGEFDNVMVIITRALSEAVNVPIGQEQLRLQVLKPRSDEQAQQREKVPQTLSLTAIDDPITLANAMVNVYSSNSMYTSRIKETNKTACQILLKMDVAKQCVEASNWARALDVRMSLRGVE
jgi:nuclear pore complex protein Nup93